MADNPYAFPLAMIPESVDNLGMSLRDWFAGQALVGLASAIQGPGCASWDYYSGAAYRIADAMLSERAKTGGAG